MNEGVIVLGNVLGVTMVCSGLYRPMGVLHG